MTEEMEVLSLLATRFSAAGIAYMVTGSMALNYYSVPRMTRDIDLVVELREEEINRLVTTLGSDWHADPEEIRDAVRRRGMFNVIHFPTGVKVDMVVRKDEPYREEEFARRRPARIGDTEVTFVAPEDLILSKLCWAKESRSELQLGDVRSLLDGPAPLDWKYLDQWARRLTVWDLYQEVRHA